MPWVQWSGDPTGRVQEWREDEAVSGRQVRGAPQDAERAARAWDGTRWVSVEGEDRRAAESEISLLDLDDIGDRVVRTDEPTLSRFVDLDVRTTGPKQGKDGRGKHGPCCRCCDAQDEEV